MRTLLCCVLALALASSAYADFNLNINGTSTMSPTDWALTGGGAATATFMGNYFEYTNVGAFYTSAPTGTTFTPTSGTATLSSASGSTANIVSVKISPQNGGTVGFNLSTFFVANSNENVTASSSGWKFAVPTSSFSSAGLPFTSVDKTSASGTPRLDLKISNETVVVPEAGAIPVLGGVLGSAYAAWSWLRARRQRNARSA